MADDHSTIKASLDANLTNNPSTKIRGSVHNTLASAILDYAKDRLNDKTIDNTGLSDECYLVYDNTSSTWIVRKVQWHVYANVAAFEADNLDVDYFPMDYIQIIENGYGQTEIRRYVDGDMRVISKYVDQS